MAHWRTTTNTIALPVTLTPDHNTIQHYQQHHRLLQNFNSTPDNDREAGFISVGLLMGVILLGLSMFLCNVVAAKFCPSLGAVANDGNGTAENNTPSNDNAALPYSSEQRLAHLVESLKSHEFYSPNAAAVASKDIEKGEGPVDVDAMPVIDLEKDDDRLPQCLICFETFVNGDAVTTHCTDKSYHRHCIMEWLLKHDNCPYCRRSFFHAIPSTGDGDNLATPAVPNLTNVSNGITMSR